MLNLWVLEQIMIPISVTLGQGRQVTEAGRILPCLHDKWKPFTQFLHNLVDIPPWSCFHLIKSRRYSIRNVFVNDFFSKISNAFLPNRIFYLPYLKNGWYSWCETKRKWVNWMLRWLGYFDLDLWLWIFKVKLYLGNGASMLNLEFAISQPKIVQLPRNKNQAYRLNTRPQMGSSVWPWQCPWPWIFRVKYRVCYISAKMVWLPRNERQTYQLNSRPQMWPWP